MKKLLLSFLLVMVIASGFAQWSINPKANRAVVGSGNTMRSNSSVSDGAGGLVIVFEESVWDGINMVGFTQIFAQRVSSGGVAQWAAPVLIATCPDYTDKSVVSDGAGGVVVLWVQKLTQGNNQPEKIYAQRLNQSGAKQWGATGKELTAMFSSYYISEMLFDNNSFVYSFAQYGAGDGDVFIQKLDMNGNVQWGTGTKINEGVGEYDGRIFKDGAGYLVALVEEYEFNNGNDEGTRLYLQKVNADGTKNGSNVFIDDLVPINGIEYYPEEVIYDGNGGLYYTTSAADDNDDTNVKLYLQHITSTGVKQFTSTLWGLEVDANAGAVIDGGGYSYWTYSASMASDGAGGVVIGWIDTRNANAGVYAQRYNSAGAKLWGATDLLLSPGVVDYFDQQSIQFDANGDLVFRLQKSLGYAKQYLYVQKTSLSGTLLYPTPGVLVSSRDTQKYNSEMVVLNDKVVLVWEDFDPTSSRTNIYYQSVFTNGALAPDINFNGFTVINLRTLEGFNSIQAAIDHAETKNGDELRIASGTYTERINVSKQLGIYGNNVGVAPWNWTKPATIIKTPSTDFLTNTSLVLLGTSNILIDGIQFDGTNDALSDAVPRTINGQANRIPRAISTVANTSSVNLQITNNKFADFSERAISLFSLNGQAGIQISNNVLDNICAVNVTSASGNGLAILVSNYTGEIANNRITRAYSAIQGQFQSYSGSTNLKISRNNITLYKNGITISGNTAFDAPPINVDDNVITAANVATWTADGLNKVGIYPRGIAIYSLSGDAKVTAARDTVTNMRWALEAYRVKKSNTDLDRFVVEAGLYQSNYIGMDSFNDANLNYDTRMVVDGVKLINNDFLGLLNENTSAFKSEMVLRNSVQILNSSPTSTYENAISIYGTNAQLNELNDTKISGAFTNFISFRSPSGNSPMTGLTVDGKDVTYDGTVAGQTFNNYKPSATFDLLLRNAVKARIYDGEDAGNTTAGIVTIPNTLPVSLIEFNASLKNNGALITWSTASELNNNHFILEKSIDGVSFNAVATINGKGTTHEKSNYQFTDVNFFQSAYYRLTQVDLNGTKTVYDEFIKHLKSLTDADKITVYPNPTVDLINIKLPTSLASTLVKLVDINGKILDSKIGNGKHELTFAVQHLPKGVYLLQYTEDSRLVSQKVVKL